MSYSNQRSFSRSDSSEEAKKHADALKKLEGDILRFNDAAQPGVLIDAIKEFVQAYYKGISSHQLRKLFDLVRRAESWKDVQLARPKFAYAQARLSGPKGKEFISTLDYFMSQIKGDEGGQVKHFKSFFEALVAYHKFYESEKSDSNG